MIFPIFGIYDDYGRIEEIENTFSHRFLEKKFGVDYIKKFDHSQLAMTQPEIYALATPTEKEMGDFIYSWQIENPFTFCTALALRRKVNFQLPHDFAEWKEEHMLEHFGVRVEFRNGHDEQPWYELSLWAPNPANAQVPEYWEELWSFDPKEYLHDYAHHIKFDKSIRNLRRRIAHDGTGMQHKGLMLHKRVLEISLEKIDAQIKESMDGGATLEEIMQQ
jgi:hypothetical protein